MAAAPAAPVIAEGDAVDDSQMESIMERFRMSDAQKDQFVENAKQMFPHMLETTIREVINSIPSEDEALDQLLQLNDHEEAMAYSEAEHNHIPVALNATVGGSVVTLKDDDPDGSLAAAIAASRDTHTHTMGERRQMDPAYNQKQVVNAEDWNRSMLKEAVFEELRRRDDFMRDKKKKRTRQDAYEMQLFLRDKFPAVEMRFIQSLFLTTEMDFYTVVLIFQLLTCGDYERLVKYGFITRDVPFRQIRCSAEKEAQRRSEAARSSSRVPEFATRLWSIFEEIVNHDYATPLNEMMRFDCAVCFETFHENDALFCTPLPGEENNERHGWCVACVVEQARANLSDLSLGKGGTGIRCLAPECKHVILYARVRKIIEANHPDMLRQFDNFVDAEAVNAANMKDVETCLKCGFRFVPEKNKDEDPVFECVECHYKHCRKCDRIYDQKHEGRDCDYENVAARKQLEEALTKAVIRQCKACGKEFMRNGGCSKMTCQCGRTQCYLCHADGIDYSHFGENGEGKCALFVNDDVVHGRDEQMRRQLLTTAAGTQNLQETDRQQLY